jgi:hypothetical protein
VDAFLQAVLEMGAAKAAGRDRVGRDSLSAGGAVCENRGVATDSTRRPRDEENDMRRCNCKDPGSCHDPDAHRTVYRTDDPRRYAAEAADEAVETSNEGVEGAES